MIENLYTFYILLNFCMFFVTTFAMRFTFPVKYRCFFIFKVCDCSFTNLTYDCSHFSFPPKFMVLKTFSARIFLYITGLLYAPCDHIRKIRISRKVLLLSHPRSVQLYFHNLDIRLFPFFYFPLSL